MAVKELDTLTGITTTYHTEGDSIAITREQDAQHVLDEVQLIKQQTGGISASRELYHVAHIPAMVIEAYCNVRGVSFHEFCVDDTHITALLNDSDYKHLRIWEGVA